MRFGLSSPDVSTVIPGMLTPAEVDMNVAYADGELFSDLLDDLAEHNWPRNYYKYPAPMANLDASGGLMPPCPGSCSA